MDTLEWTTNKGRLASIQEGDTISITIVYDMSPTGTISLVSGQLPPGITFNPVTQVLSGTVGSITTDTEYFFTLRIQNTLGVYDRSFQIMVENVLNVFLTPSDILYQGGFYQIGQYVNFKFETDSTETITYTFVNGDLPEGITFTNDGRLTGIIKDNSKEYVFTIRANTDPSIEKEFQMYVDVISQRPPFWTTLDGFIGYLYDGTQFNFDLTGGDSDGSVVFFSLKSGSSLPNGLTLTNGILSGIPTNNQLGKFQFTLQITDNTSTVDREFFVYLNIDPDNTIIIDNSNLVNNLFSMNVILDEPIATRVPATQNQRWTRYEVISGQLPSGLQIDITTGEFIGVVSKLATLGDYLFTVRVYNFDKFQEEVNCKITINTNIAIRDSRVSLFLTGNDRIEFYKFSNTYRIPYDRIFRPNDPNFGITKTTELPLMRYTNVSFQDLIDLFEDRIAGHVYIDKIKSVPVQNSNGDIICECVVATMKSTLHTALDVAGNIKNSTPNIIRSVISENTDSPMGQFYNWQSENVVFDIVNNILTINNHDIETGEIVQFRNQTLPSPLVNSRLYHAIKIDSNNIRIANSFIESQNNNFIVFDTNETIRTAVAHVHLDAIPIVYCNIGDGSAVANNILITEKIQTTNAFIGLGESSTSFNGNINILWLDDLFPFRSN